MFFKECATAFEKISRKMRLLLKDSKKNVLLRIMSTQKMF